MLLFCSANISHAKTTVKKVQYPRCSVTIRATPTQLLHEQRQQVIQTGGDSSDKPTAMHSRSMAGSQCWTTDSKRTGSLSAPDVNSTGNDQPWKKACCGIPTRVHPHLPGLVLTQYATWLAAQKAMPVEQEKRKKKKKKKENEQNWNVEVWFFSNLLKVCGTFGVKTTLEW